MKPWKHYEVIQTSTVGEVQIRFGTMKTGKAKVWNSFFTEIISKDVTILREHPSSLYISFLEAANIFRSQGFELNIYGLHKDFRLTTVASGTMPNIPHRVSIIDPVEEGI